MKISTIKRLQKFYSSMCEGDWHHQYGFDITNIDNLGWSINVELYDSYLYGRPFEKVSVQREKEDDWYFCEVKDTNFSGCCGPENLEEILIIFLDWADEQYVLYCQEQ